MKYDEIIEKHRALKALEEQEGNALGKVFWEKHEELKLFLREVLKDSGFIFGLEPVQLLRFISLCSTYRPYEPHTILSMLAACSVE